MSITKGFGGNIMKATVLIDNITKNELLAEWGLAFYIEYGDKNILLDTGASDLFLENAALLGLDLTKIDFGALSHAHSDHSDGMAGFFSANKTAPFYLRDTAYKEYYDDRENPDGGYTYAGIRRDILTDFADRIVYVSGDFEICPGVYLIPHKTPGLEEIGRRSGMFVLADGEYHFDRYDHEQSLVFDTEKGLVIFNSCSHGGADNIINEIKATFPGKNIRAIVGGFHLYNTPADEVRAFAQRVKDTGIELVVTGHCTGEESFAVLKEVLGDTAVQFCSGLVIEF